MRARGSPEGLEAGDGRFLGRLGVAWLVVIAAERGDAGGRSCLRSASRLPQKGNSIGWLLRRAFISLL